MSQFRRQQTSARRRGIQDFVFATLGAETSEREFMQAEDHVTDILANHTFLGTDPLVVRRDVDLLIARLQSSAIREETVNMSQQIIQDVFESCADSELAADVFRFMLLMAGRPGFLTQRDSRRIAFERQSQLDAFAQLRLEENLLCASMVQQVKDELLCGNSDGEDPQEQVNDVEAGISDDDFIPDVPSPARLVAASSSSTDVGDTAPPTPRIELPGDFRDPRSVDVFQNLPQTSRSILALAARQDSATVNQELDFLRVHANIDVINRHTAGSTDQAIHGLAAISEDWIVWDSLHMLLGVSTAIFRVQDSRIELREEAYHLSSSHASTGALRGTLQILAQCGEVILRNRRGSRDCFRTIAETCVDLAVDAIETRRFKTLIDLLVWLQTEQLPQLVETEYESIEAVEIDRVARSCKLPLAALALATDVENAFIQSRSGPSRLLQILNLDLPGVSSGNEEMCAAGASSMSSWLDLTAGFEPLPVAIGKQIREPVRNMEQKFNREQLGVLVRQKHLSDFLRVIRIVCFFEGCDWENSLDAQTGLKAMGVSSAVAESVTLTPSLKPRLGAIFGMDRSKEIANVITDQQMEKLNVVYNLLVETRKARRCLSRLVWKELFVSEIFAVAAAKFRFKAAHFVTCLDQYFRISVVIPAINQFDECFVNARSIEEATRLHSVLVEQVFAGCMQTSEYSVVVDCLWSILEVCSTFSDLMEAHSDNGLDRSFMSEGSRSPDLLLPPEDPRKVYDLSVRFERRRVQFMSLLTAQSIVYGTEREAAILLNHLNRFH